MSLPRVAVVKSPLGDTLSLAAMHGYEELGRPFRYELDLTTTDPDIDFNAILGQTMTVELELHDGSTREFTGHVTEFSLAGGLGRNVLYRAVLRPWLELLNYRRNCRIFQRMTVPDVIKQVFREAGFSDLEDRLSDSYRTWEYLVQYRESDLAFASRMMEQEGIYYYVKHADGVHTVVLCDSASAHEPVPGYESIPYYPPEMQRRDRDHIDSWNLTRHIKPGIVSANDFNFERPSANLIAQRTEPEEKAGAHYDDFDYPGEYVDLSEGNKEVRVRIEAHHAGSELVQATGDARGLSVGATFTLEKFPRSDQNKEYLVVQANHHIRVNADESGLASGEAAYRCELTAMDGARPFRSARTTPRPLVEGPQTAIVVGPAGEEIYSDEYGRVKIKFHWDRLGKGDENSSCWVRVAQIWAGTGFGGMHVPRIGQEVIVDFLEGDPDRPIITGRVYNFENPVPYELPAGQTQSGIKSRSTKGGAPSNFNELRFEDKIGNELVSMQAEKDLSVTVKNAESRSVGANRSTGIGTDDALDVGANRTATIGADDTETVVASQTVSVGASQTITVTATRSVTSAIEQITTGIRNKDVGATETTTIGASRTETVGASESITIGAGQTVTVSGARSLTIGGGDTVDITGKRSQSVSASDQLSVGQKLTIDAGDQIVLQAGSASLTLKKNGDILLDGKNLKFNGSGKIFVTASSKVTVKGSKITHN